MSEGSNIKERCSICGKSLKIGEGRFRTMGQVFCIECYYKYHLLDKVKCDEDENKDRDI